MTPRYVEILLLELENRMKAEPSYTQSSFARDLHMSRSTLSEILSLKHGLSYRMARKVVKELKLTEPQELEFLDSVLAQLGQKSRVSLAAKKRQEKREMESTKRELSEDIFSVIANWYHLAIVEKASQFPNGITASEAADTFELSFQTAEIALLRLQRVGMVRELSGRYHVQTRRSKSSDEIPSEAVRQFHREINQRAMQALDETDVDQREFGSVVLSLNENQLLEAKAMLKDFRKSFLERLDPGGSQQAGKVCALNLSLFSLERPDR